MAKSTCRLGLMIVTAVIVFWKFTDTPLGRIVVWLCGYVVTPTRKHHSSTAIGYSATGTIVNTGLRIHDSWIHNTLTFTRS